MKVIEVGLRDINKLSEKIACCIGFFDGIHIGHQTLINNTVEFANKIGVKSGLITFSPDPWVITKKITDVKHINDIESKKELLCELGMDYLIILKFDEEMARLSSKEFMDFLVCNIDLVALIYGFDFHYGYKGQGNKETIMTELAEDIYKICIDSVDDQIGKISTSRIDISLKKGLIKEVNEMLGYNFFIKGLVIKGRQLGQTINFPTANVEYDTDILLPKIGVYKGYVRYNGKHYKAVINIGNNPTFNYTRRLSLEVHIIDFDKEIYNEELKVIFIDYIRDEKKFDNIDELKMEIYNNVDETKKLPDYLLNGNFK